MKHNQFLRTTNGRNTYSQACQDLFVMDMLQKKKNGFYFEIGASHPFESNNTFILESKLNWTGISIEIDEEVASVYNRFRLNKCIVGDATDLNYKELFETNNMPKIINYLSIDIEPAENTLKALLKLPMNDYRFSVITYEHDRYVSGDFYMIESRKYLESYGYKLIVSNVKTNGRDFEDWWVDPNIISKELWESFISSDIEGKDIF
jgi:hypothetical protein